MTKKTKRSQSEETITARNSSGYTAPAAIAADPVILTVREDELSVLMIESPDGAWSLPGGFVGEDESPEQTALRKLKEKTGVAADSAYVEQLKTYASPQRDPRGWIPSIAYLALIPSDDKISSPAEWKPLSSLPDRISFDHRDIIADGLERIRGKLWYSNVAAGVLPPEFTLRQARIAYSAISGEDYDPGNFARDLRASKLITATGETARGGSGRPAKLYSFRSLEPAWSPRHGAKSSQAAGSG